MNNDSVVEIGSKEEVDIRTYNHIFSDFNQSNPNDEIRLGYESNYSSITFSPGKETVFHCPLIPKDKDKLYISISDSNFINDGSICGTAPYKSDRIYVKNAKYEWKSEWGNYEYDGIKLFDRKIPPIDNGEFLCTWLSGDILNPSEAVWKDRWYNPKKITKELAAASEDEVKNGIIDVDSELKLINGCQYKYFRVGNKEIEEIVSHNDDNMMVHIDKWGLDNCLNSSKIGEEAIPRCNNCNEKMFNAYNVNPKRKDDFAVKFDGKSTIQIDRCKSFDIGNNDFTMMAYIRHDDWKNSSAYGIMDMGYHGGIQIGVAPKPRNTMIALLGAENGNENDFKFCTNSTVFKQISKRDVKTEDKILDIALDDEYFCWCITEKDIIKADLNGNFILRYTFNSEEKAKNLNRIQVLGNAGKGSNGYGFLALYNSEHVNEAIVFNMMTMRTEKTTRISFIGKNTIINHEEEWLEIHDSKCIKRTINDRIGNDDREILLLDDGDIVKYIEVDSSNFIYVLVKNKNNEDIVYKYFQDRDGKYMRACSSHKKYDAKNFGNAKKIIITTRFENSKLIDAINIIYEGGYVVTFDTNLKRLDSANITGSVNNIQIAVGNYEWSRRFCNNVVYSRIVLGTQKELNTDGGSKILLTIPLENVSDKDWHQFAIRKETVNEKQSKLTLSVDGNLKDEYINNSENCVTSVGRPNLILGGECGFGTELKAEHPIYNAYWNGYMDDVRVYNKALRDDDLGYIQMLKYDAESLRWNVEIPNRHYIESIKRVYKMKMPGSKSSVYDIDINGYKCDNPNSDIVKEKISTIIKQTLPYVSPTYSKNSKIAFH